MKKMEIIIVDDNPHFQNALKFTLEDSFADRIKIIDFANNGKEFLEKLNRKYYDLVFMDVVMPNMDGFQATREALKLYRNITIIAVSFHSDLKYIKQMLEVGARTYLIKDDINIEFLDKLVSKECLQFPVV